MRQYHLAQKEQEFASTWVAELEAAGMIKECNSPYAAPTVIAPKKDSDGNWTKLRYAIDYRRLNEDTVKDAYPTPVADELLARLSEPVKGSPDGRPKRYYTKYDATAAFHQVKLSENAQTCMAFHAGNRLMT